jgi:hypothetical protein
MRGFECNDVPVSLRRGSYAAGTGDPNDNAGDDLPRVGVCPARERLAFEISTVRIFAFSTSRSTRVPWAFLSVLRTNEVMTKLHFMSTSSLR